MNKSTTEERKRAWLVLLACFCFFFAALLGGLTVLVPVAAFAAGYWTCKL